MKKKILVFSSLIMTSSCCLISSQTVINSKYKRATYEQMAVPVIAAQKKYEENAAKVDELIESIFEYKSQSDDQQFLDTMDKFYKKLKTFYDYDLARMDKDIREINFAIKEEVEKYNRRIKQQSSSYQEKEKLSLKGIQHVINSAPLYEKPNINSKSICIMELGIVEIISQVNDKFYLAKTKKNRFTQEEIEGYLWIGWVK